MSDRATKQSTANRADETSDGIEPEAVQTIEAYETGDNVVIYDAEDPLAWIETDAAVPITEMT